MKLPYKKSQILKTITIDGINVIEAGDLLAIYELFDSGKLTRIMAWQIIRMVHEGKIKCPLSIYGTLTVYSLAKDVKQFKKLYSQGCELLTANNVIEEESLDIGEDIVNEIVKSLKSGKFSIQMQDDGTIIKKNDNDLPNTDRFKNFN